MISYLRNPLSFPSSNWMALLSVIINYIFTHFSPVEIFCWWILWFVDIEVPRNGSVEDLKRAVVETFSHCSISWYLLSTHIAKYQNFMGLKELLEISIEAFLANSTWILTWIWFYCRLHVWSHFCLSYCGQKLLADDDLIGTYGIKDGDEV